MSPDLDNVEFSPPPEAPVFEPSEEEFRDPLAYIAKIRPFAEKTGICKIRPPPDWQPSFSVEVENFRFTPRIQRLNELEAKSRVKLNFLDHIAKFWELQGSALRLPNVEKKPLDLYLLHKTVQEEGGFEDVTRGRKWSRVAQKMGYTQGKNYAMLRSHYEKVLFPYDVFLSGAMTGGENMKKAGQRALKGGKSDEDDEEYKPPDGVSDCIDATCLRNTRNKYVEEEELDKSQGSEEIWMGKDPHMSRTPELKKLQFLAPGPKWNKRLQAEDAKDAKAEGLHPQSWQTKDRPKSNIKEIRELTRRKPGKTTKDKSAPFFNQFKWEDYTCQVCDRGDDEESMLLCDECDSSYHTFCLIPPLNSVPPGDWRCPKCVAQACQQPHQAYGFEQAKKEYTLREFGVMADKFKEDYFGIPPHEVPPELVEKEFWRLVNSLDDEVVVEYGADLHTAEHGSGFPTRDNSDDPDDEDYIRSWWNLNNLPVHEKSVLKFINADISGMKQLKQLFAKKLIWHYDLHINSCDERSAVVPWLYIGMCFSSFCWHNEDHWSYSINYLHWGEPKTWYGVPGEEAEHFEKCMKEAAPELFEAQPDLLHHLVTIISPVALMKAGVTVVRTNQYAGEFIITFPRAYHAGFNQGYNCAEAVNFAPSDWLPIGRKCIDHYRTMKRCPVFSHEELICKMAADPEYLDLELAKAVYLDLEAIVREEMELRIDLKKQGVPEVAREVYELVPDDERQCVVCKTTCFLSSARCSCHTKELACLRHVFNLCACPTQEKEIRYRYSLEELPAMLNQLKKRADSFDNWCQEVESAIKAEAENKKDLSELKDLLAEAETNQFPPCELVEDLKGVVVEAEQCAQVATQLFIKKHKTRQVSSSSQPQPPKLTLEELKDFINQVQNLPCSIKEARLIQGLMTQVENFQYEARVVLSEGCYDIDRLNELLEHGNSLEIDLPEVSELKQDLKAARWLEKVTSTMQSEELIPLDTIRSLVEQGASVTVKQALEQPMEDLKELLYASDRLEEKAKLCLQAKPRHGITTLEVIVAEASKVNILLPNVNALKETLKKAKEWSERVEKIQNDEYYPYFDVLEALAMRGRPIPVRLEQLPHMESQVAAAKAWKDRTVRTFVKKGSSKTLFELLAPRKDIGDYRMYVKPKKRKEKEEREKDKKERDREREQKLESINLDNYVAPNPSFLRKQFQVDETSELEAMKNLRAENLQRVKIEDSEGVFCVCRKPAEGLMIRCALCYDWLHAACVPLPKSCVGKSVGKGSSSVIISNEVKFLCPFCSRSRRPRLETILSLLVSLQKLPVRMPEGEALRFLTERAMNWQERVKIRLDDATIRNLLVELNSAALNLNSRTDIAVVDTDKKIAPKDKNSIVPSSFIMDGPLPPVKPFGEAVATQQSSSDGRVGVLSGPKEETDPLLSRQPLSDVGSDVQENSSQQDLKSVEVKTSSKIEEIQEIRPRCESESEPGIKRHSESEESTGPVDLECDEHMTDSPKSSVNKDAPTTGSLPTGKESGKESELSPPAETVDVQNATPETPRQPLAKQEQSTKLSVEVMDEIQNLLLEGDLLEITLDETQKLWMIVQNQRPLQWDDCKIIDGEYRRSLLKERKKRKRKVDGKTGKEKKDSISEVTGDLLKTCREKSAKSAETEVVKKKRVKAEVPATEKGEDEVIKVEDDQEEENEDYDEDCSAHPCQQPLGDEVGWVQCDLCSKWYHVVCVGITAAEADAMETYSCPYCIKKNERKRVRVKDHSKKSDSLAKDSAESDVVCVDVTSGSAETPNPLDQINIVNVVSKASMGEEVRIGDASNEDNVIGDSQTIEANPTIKDSMAVEDSQMPESHEATVGQGEEMSEGASNLFDSLLSDEDGSDDVKNVLLIDEVESCTESMEVDSAAENDDS